MAIVRRLCLVFFLAVVSCHTQEKPKKPPPPPKQSAGAADVDPRAGRILFLMGTTLKNAEGMSFTADVVYEEVLETGLKFERSLSVDLKARRPDRLRVDFNGDGDRRLLTCDGRTVTLVERTLRLFGACPAAANLDATLDLVAADHGITVPCADFLFSDPYAILSESLKAGSYLRIVKVRGLSAHHLVFSQQGLDWQIWIDTGPRALPLRMVMTYVDAEGAPRFEADLTNWQLNPSLPDTEFTADVAGMEKIDFQNSAEHEIGSGTMKKIILTSIVSVLALLLLAADGKARGGYRGGGLRMGSVRHYGNYDRAPERRQDERQAYRGTGYKGDPAARHAEVAHAAAPVDPAVREGDGRRVAVGATVSTLPRGYRRYRWNNAYWYSSGGTWYMDGTQDGTEYVVTDPPVGMTVDALPGPAQHVVVEGRTLYLCQGIYYKAIWTDGHATYTVVKAP